MKKIFNIVALLLLISFGAQAQIDRSVIPGPGPATKLDFGKSTKFELKNGLKVIVVENHKLPTISYSLRLDIDPIYEGDIAGYTSLAGSLMRAGTTNLSKVEIDERIDFIGGSLMTSSGGISARGLKKHNDELLTLMCDVLYNPTYPEEELEKEKQQIITGLKVQKDNMESIQSSVTNALLYGKETANGEVLTEETVNKISVDDLKAYHSTYFRPNAAYLIIIGDITVKEAKKLVKSRFGKWEAKEVPEHPFVYPEKMNEPMYAIANKDAATQASIILKYTNNLTIGHDDVMAANVMNRVLGGGGFSSRLFQNLREDKAWTYGAYSSLRPNEYVGEFSASSTVRASVADSALIEIRKEMERMQTEEIDDETLQLIKNALAGSFARSLEKPSTIANFAYSIDKYNLPADYYETYMERLDAVDAKAVKEMAKKYLTPENALYFAVGDVGVIRPLLEKMANGKEVKEYDYYANEVERSAIPANLTATDVVNKYINAIGGAEKLKAVNSLTTVGEASIQGMKVVIESAQANGKLCMETKINGNTATKQVYDGKTAIVYAQGQRHELPEPIASEMKKQTIIFPELSLLENPDAVLTGVDKVNNADVYVLKADGTSYYFDQKTGLKLKTIAPSAAGTTTIIFSDYKAHDGILLPTSYEQTTGAQNITIKIASAKLNGEVDESIFK